jgi:hypothetical protein
LSARFAPLMASIMGFAESSGRTISLCAMVGLGVAVEECLDSLHCRR